MDTVNMLGVYVIAKQTHLVGTNPDVSVVVAGHTVDITVNTNTCQTQSVAYRGIPGVCTFVIFEQSTLPVEPDVIRLVGKSLQRLTSPQLLNSNLAGTPDGVLLVHHVAADDSSVIIDNQCTILTFADGTDGTLWHTSYVI